MNHLLSKIMCYNIFLVGAENSGGKLSVESFYNSNPSESFIEILFGEKDD